MCQHISQQRRSQFPQKAFWASNDACYYIFLTFSFQHLDYVPRASRYYHHLIALVWRERRRRHFLMRASVGSTLSKTGARTFSAACTARNYLNSEVSGGSFPDSKLSSTAAGCYTYKQPTGNFNSATALQFAWILHKFIFSHFAIKFGFSSTGERTFKIKMALPKLADLEF